MNEKFYAHTPAEGSEVWHDLTSHLERVSRLAHENASKFGAGELGRLAGSWHDLGKFNPDFQDYLKRCHEAALSEEKAPRGGSVPHAVYGAVHALRNAEREEMEWLVPVIQGHHIGLRSRDDYVQALKNPETSTIYENLLPTLDAVVAKTSEAHGVEMVSDLPGDHLQLEFLVRMLFSSLVDADFLDTETHFEPETTKLRGSESSVEDLWRVLEGKQESLLEKARRNPTTVNEVRREVYEDCLRTAEGERGVFRLAVPTGGGKTRSGLAFALKHAVWNNERQGDENGRMRRVIVAVPYTSIIDQTAREYRQIFASLGTDAVLEHHSAVRRTVSGKRDAESFEDQRVKARLATQNWDAPLVVTTTVQLFESLFSNRTSRCRKLHNLTNSVIVLDEVQTLPLGLLAPIVDVLKELVRRYGVSVVLCTATQPALEETSRYMQGFREGAVRDIVPQEKAAGHFVKLKRVEYEIEKEKLNWNGVAKKFIEAARERRGLIILNARRDALSVLDALEKLGETKHLVHLSTLLCGAHRRDVLAYVRTRLAEKEEPCLLVSTQVVEAGVDLDFPAVFRAMGPLDRIVQAAGRCNREGTMEGFGRVVVFEPEEGRMPPGEYATAVGVTRAMLSREPDLHRPEVLREYFSSLYRVDDTDKKEIEKYRKRHDYPEVAERFRFIEAPTVPVVVEYEERDERREAERRRLLDRIRRDGKLLSGDQRRLQPYIVSLFEHDLKGNEWMLEPLTEDGEVKLWTGNYDGLRGVSALSNDPSDLIWGF